MTAAQSGDARPRKRRGLKRALGKAAPELARAIGGPLAGAAVSAVAKAVLGEETADEAQLEDALAEATPEQRAALAKAEADFRIAIRRAAIDEARIAADDRANARAREVAREDRTPAIMGGLIIFGFFLVLGAMVARRLPEGTETEFSIMLGALATMTAAVVNYYFGSSAGSREKTRLLSLGAKSEDA
jgi:hypothetical protein